MTTLPLKTFRLPRLPALPVRPSYRPFAAAAAFAVALLLGSGAPSAAAEPAWKAGCAYKMTSGIPGNGHGILADVCRAFTFCEAMANQGRPNMMAMGCFGYQTPARRS